MKDEQIAAIVGCSCLGWETDPDCILHGFSREHVTSADLISIAELRARIEMCLNFHDNLACPCSHCARGYAILGDIQLIMRKLTAQRGENFRLLGVLVQEKMDAEARNKRLRETLSRTRKASIHLKETA